MHCSTREPLRTLRRPGKDIRSATVKPVVNSSCLERCYHGCGHTNYTCLAICAWRTVCFANRKSSSLLIFRWMWQVLLDGVAVHEHDHRWLHRNISIVGQEPTLYARSIRENIIYGLEGKLSQWSQSRRDRRSASIDEFPKEYVILETCHCSTECTCNSSSELERRLGGPREIPTSLGWW